MRTLSHLEWDDVVWTLLSLFLFYVQLKMSLYWYKLCMRSGQKVKKERENERSKGNVQTDESEIFIFFFCSLSLGIFTFLPAKWYITSLRTSVFSALKGKWRHISIKKPKAGIWSHNYSPPSPLIEWFSYTSMHILSYSSPFVVYYRILNTVSRATQQDLVVSPSWIY